MSSSALQAPFARIWLIGCGKMAGAMLSRWIDSGVVAAGSVDVVNREDRDVPGGVRQARDLPGGPLPDLVLLGVKPQQLGKVAQMFGPPLLQRLTGKGRAPASSGAQLGPGFRREGVEEAAPLLVSILAGTRTCSLTAAFPGSIVVRAMPNLPVAIGKGVVALHGADGTEPWRTQLDTLMAPLGLVEWMADEALFDVVTALSGSGPAFLYRFAEALAVGGAALGLDPAQADRLARATVEGAAAQAVADARSLHRMAEAVASPGGSTRAGLDVLDADDALRRLAAATLAAARNRNIELAVEAGG